MKGFLQAFGAVIAVLAATVVAVLGIYLLLGLRPVRATVMGRILNEQGQPLVGADITAIPMPVNFTMIEAAPAGQNSVDGQALTSVVNEALLCTCALNIIREWRQD